jgi:hypothetical protein
MRLALMARRPAPVWAVEPPYWLVSTLAPVPGRTPLALAMCPELARRTARIAPSENLTRFLDVCDLYRETELYKVVFVSDVAHWLEFEVRRDWAQLGIDPDAALAELEQCSPWIEVGLTEDAYWLADDADSLVSVKGAGGTEYITRAEREGARDMVRMNVTRMMTDNWPGLIEGLVKDGTLPSG